MGYITKYTKAQSMLELIIYSMIEIKLNY